MNPDHLSDEVLLLRMDGELSEVQEAGVAQHLQECESCRQRYNSIQGFLSDVSGMEPTAGATEDARQELAETIADAAQRRAPLWLQPRFLAQAAMAVALIVSALALRHLDAPLQDAMGAYEETGPEPNPALTPGSVHTVDLAELCVMPDKDLDPLVAPEKQRAIFVSYGLNEKQAHAYQVDYLINPQLGGDDDLENLWPEPYHATVWNARAKDALETRLHGMVCSGQIGLAEAQQAIAKDWIGAYKQVFHASRPVEVRAAVDPPTQ